MKHENQVSNLEYSKRLKELRVKQESLYWWDIGGSFFLKQKFGYLQIDDNFTEPVFVKSREMGLKFSAFTVAELGEMLPNKYGSFKSFTGNWQATEVLGTKLQIFESDTEANARAKMLIHLLENKLITL